MHLLKHEYAHENAYILTVSEIKDSVWLERIKKLVPGFIPDNSEDKIVFFEKGVYSLGVFMNIACAYPLYTHSNNVLSEHLPSILRYLVLTIKNIKKPKELINEIGFKFFFYLEGEPLVKNFVKIRKTVKTILETSLDKEFSEYKRSLNFDFLGEIIDPECLVDYSMISFTATPGFKHISSLGNHFCL
jgi:hypothetical protein